MIDELFKTLKECLVNYSPPVVELINFQTNNPDKVLITSILSTRTKDAVTLKASKNLFSKINSIKDLKKLSVEEIEKLIFPVGFYKVKAKNLKELPSKIPCDFDELIKIKGVGRKVANLYLSVVCNQDTICVDVHVHRISNRLGLVNTKTPFETELSLEKVLPKKYWSKINSLFVMLGQSICTPINPKCSNCCIEKFCKKILKK